MTQIAPRKFYDDLDNFHEIRKALKRERYLKSFKFIYGYFFNDHHSWVNSTILQEALCIHNPATAYQVLSSLVVLNLLEKRKMGHKKVLFLQKNEKWWHIFKKEVDQIG